MIEEFGPYDAHFVQIPNSSFKNWCMIETRKFHFSFILSLFLCTNNHYHVFYSNSLSLALFDLPFKSLVPYFICFPTYQLNSCVSAFKREILRSQISPQSTAYFSYHYFFLINKIFKLILKKDTPYNIPPPQKKK